MKKLTSRILTLFLLVPLISSCHNNKVSETVSKIQITGGKDTAIYPVVQTSVVGENVFSLQSVKLIISEGTEEISSKLLKNLFEKRGIKVEDNAAVSVYLGQAGTLSEQLSIFSTEADNNPQGYTICAGDNKIVLAGNDTDGLFYSVVSLDTLIKDNKIKECVIKDYPTIKERGIIEGFYGEPWSHEDRLSIIDFMGKVKLNTYIYAPKDDLKHRDNWREPYNNEELDRFRELLSKCKENHVKFVFAISPGKDFDFTGDYEGDFETLTNKCKDLYNLGIRDYAVFLDDIDVAKRSPEGHARLLNDFQKKFCEANEGVSDLITVFSEYFEGAITDGYTGEIAKTLDKRVRVMWTGDDVIPAKLTKDDLTHINGIYDRNMMIWWNYPVNDYAPDNLFIGPALGLDAKLSDSVSGFISNPMNQAEASKIPLFTVADYVWNPKSYKAAASCDAALKILHPETYDSLKKVCSILSGNIINSYTDSAEFKNLLDKLNSTSVSGDKINSTADELIKLFKSLSEAVDDIRSKDTNKNFVDEISPWLDKAKAYAEMGQTLLDALKNSKDREASWNNYLKYVQQTDSIKDNKKVVSGSVIAPAFKNIVNKLEAVITTDSLSSAFTASFNCADSKISASDITVYQDYVIGNAVDNDEKTYFWWGGASPQGSYVMLDLVEVTEVKNIVLKSGVDGHKDDYFHSGQMQYSSDGKNWTNIGEVQTKPEIAMQNLDFKARYIRYICTEDQKYWMCMSEFHVNYTVSVNNVSVTPEGSVGSEIDRLFDGKLSTCYIPVHNPQAGEAININTKNFKAKKLEIYGQTISGAEVTACLSDGSEKSLGKLEKNYFTADVPENTVIIKITWTDSNVLPEINEIVFS